MAPFLAGARARQDEYELYIVEIDTFAWHSLAILSVIHRDIIRDKRRVMFQRNASLMAYSAHDSRP